MRNLFRYYTLRSGIHKGNKKDREYVSKRGRKREWRKKLHAARSLNDFLRIEIQEPDMSGSSSLSGSNNTNSNSSHGRMQQLQNSPKTSSLRRVQSFHSPSSSSSHIKQAKFQRTQSFNSNNNDNNLPNNKSNSLTITDYEEVEQQLGMNGIMLLQTTYKLRETRMQASSTIQSMPFNLSLLQSRSNDGGSSSSASSCIHESENEVDDSNHDDIGISDDNEIIDNHEGNDVINLTINPLIDPEKARLNAASQLKYFLQGVVKRNHLSINDFLIKDSLSVMDCGRHYLSEQSRNAIFNYHQEVEKCLHWMANVGLNEKGGGQQYHQAMKNGIKHPMSSLSTSSTLPKQQQQPMSSSMGATSTSTSANTSFMDGDMHLQFNNNQHNNDKSDSDIKLYKEISDRLNLLRKLKHNMGRTALMLSGGGAQAMYHLGTIKALCESKLYDDIEVISGTSGGSIVAAMCAQKTREELLRDVCVPHVSTDYGLTGEMKKGDIRWFPRIMQMGEFWLKTRLMVDSKEFKRCCDFYYGDMTFEEAFERTGKHVCITVSASRADGSDSGGGGAQRLLLNHISTPHVTLASAVAASCALPGVMVRMSCPMMCYY